LNAKVAIDSMKNELLSNDPSADMMEHFARVLMNLACSNTGIDNLVENDGIQVLIDSIRNNIHFSNHPGFVYAAIKTLHNIAIEHDEHRRTMIQYGVLDIIKRAQADHSKEQNLMSWCDRAKHAIESFDGPELSLEMVLNEMNEEDEYSIPFEIEAIMSPGGSIMITEEDITDLEL
jgi:predicted component of type VI protein secretion system